METLLSKNVLERAGWTLAQAGLGYAITALAGISTWWAIPLATLLSAVKTNIVDRRRDA